MHADELAIDAGLVRRLVDAQFPAWRRLPIRVVPSWGTDNALYRLGEELVVRLPRREQNVAGLERELEWLPKLAPSLPVAVSEPVARGAPGEEYPWPWAVYRWLQGETLPFEVVGASDDVARDLVAFVSALRRVELDGPVGFRGVALRARDRATGSFLAALDRKIDTAPLRAIWAEALAAPEWAGKPTWTHGDLDLRNLLFDDGRLVAVLDFAGVGVGDPACDVASAWKVLDAERRDRFRGELDVDEATWARARGWVAHQIAGALSYYTVENNPELYLEAERWLGEVLG